jgi:hypothetical protein
MRTTIPSSLHLFRQCLLLGFLLTPVLAVGQVPNFEDTLRLAEEGDAVAQYNLGWMYDHGEGVPENNTEAMKWYRLAADQGLAAAQRNIGALYENGVEVPQDYAEAVKWFRLAADQGDANAQYNLGVMYALGRGVPENYVTAYAWFNISAASGDELAISNRSAAEARMTPAQIAEAQQLSTEIFERIQQGSQ